MDIFSKSKNIALLAQLNQVMKGQEHAKKALITLINRSYLRYYQHHALMKPIDDCVTNKNVLLIGESGSGKTLLVDTLAKLMHFPLVKINATDLCPTGNTDGVNLRQLHKLILENAKELVVTDKRYHSVEGTMDQTVVFIDEIDKLCLSFDSSGNWNKHVQANFLKLFENKGQFHSLSFIFAGAFVGINKQAKTKSIGFQKEEDSTTLVDWSNEVIKFGLLPELVGRIHNVIKFTSLTKSDYKEILDIHILPNKQKELSHYCTTELSLTDEEIEILITKSMSSGQGIRYLIKHLDMLMIEHEYNLDNEPVIQCNR